MRHIVGPAGCNRERRNVVMKDWHIRKERQVDSSRAVIPGHGDSIRLVSDRSGEMSARCGIGCMHGVTTGREKQKFVRLVSIRLRFEVPVGAKIHCDNYVISLIFRSLDVKPTDPILDL